MVMMRLARRDDVGAVAVITAICSLVLFGVAALTVDLGRAWEVRRQSQSEVDLAALAGALHLPTDPVVACATALQYLAENTPAGEARDAVDQPSACSATGTSDKQVQITNNKTRITVTTHPQIINFGLAGALGFRNGVTGASATAEIRSPGGIDPFSVSFSTPYGLQCLHDNGGASGSAVRAALIQAPPAGAPSLTSVTPPVVPIGEQPKVTINGSNLSNVTKVRAGTIVTDVNAGDAHQKSVDFFPAVQSQPVGPFPLEVFDPATGWSTITATTPTIRWAYVTPTVTAVTPNVGWNGDVVTVTGTHFGGNITVLFGAVPATGVTVNATANSLTATAPVGADGTTVDVHVQNLAGLSAISKGDKFTYKKPPAPTVTSVSPNTGKQAGGDTVVITGTNFGANPTVKFGTATATVQPGGTATTVTVLSPAGTGTVDVTVTSTVGTSATNPNDRFAYGVPPAVTSVTPNGGPASGGTPVAITGTNFTASSVVFFGGSLATSVVFVDATHLTAISPPGIGTVDVQVQSQYGLSPIVNADQFTYIALADSCGSATGDFGYLFVHNNDVNANGNAANTTMELNIIKGIDHVPAFWPTVDPVPNATEFATVPVPLDTECLQGNTRLQGSWTKLDADPQAYTDGFNCMEVQNGGKVADAGAAFLDGMSYKNAAGDTVTLPARLLDPPAGDNRGTVLGRINMDTDSINDFLNGIDFSTFAGDLADVPAHLNDGQLLKSSIVGCPRFMVLPVIHTNIDPAAGQYPLQDFVGAFVESFTPKGGGATPQVGAIKAYVFPLDWLGGATPDVDGSIPFIGKGPIVPVLVK
jgi:hypothetical protein